MDLSTAKWRKSSRSTGQGQCVELAVSDERAAVRDSKNPGGGVLLVPLVAIRTLLHRL
ncbi:DUF397 domain-containing protein [Actinokineospora soli]|uniref:DUF397 domain-containing protein n=1 Tax=Actinokineospora soli TaxID=1048753 RepID=A0ABW2THV2_9PSEU